MYSRSFFGISKPPVLRSHDDSYAKHYMVSDLPQYWDGLVLKRMRHNQTTPLKTNMSPENQWLEDVFPTEIVVFQGTC